MTCKCWYYFLVPPPPPPPASCTHACGATLFYPSNLVITPPPPPPSCTPCGAALYACQSSLTVFYPSTPAATPPSSTPCGAALCQSSLTVFYPAPPPPPPGPILYPLWCCLMPILPYSILPEQPGHFPPPPPPPPPSCTLCGVLQYSTRAPPAATPPSSTPCGAALCQSSLTVFYPAPWSLPPPPRPHPLPPVVLPYANPPLQYSTRATWSFPPPPPILYPLWCPAVFYPSTPGRYTPSCSSLVSMEPSTLPFTPLSPPTWHLMGMWWPA